MMRSVRWLMPVLFGCATALGAQDLAWGVHGSVNLPQGDLKTALDSKAGFTVGGHLGVYLKDGHELRPRLEYTRYDGGSFSLTSVTFKNTIVALGFGGDYLYHLEGRHRGTYLLAGAGFQWWTVEPRQGDSTHENGLSLQAGAGYRFSPRVAVEAAYSTSRFRADQGRANAVTVGMSIRF